MSAKILEFPKKPGSEQLYGTPVANRTQQKKERTIMVSESVMDALLDAADQLCRAKAAARAGNPEGVRVILCEEPDP